MPKSLTTTLSGSIMEASCFTTSTPKASSPRKMLPRPATSTLPSMTVLGFFGIDRLNFVRREEEPMSGLAQHSQIATGIVFQHHRQVDLIFEVALNGLDDSYASSHGDVHDIGALLRPKAHAIADVQFYSESCHAGQRRRLRLQRIPFTSHGYQSAASYESSHECASIARVPSARFVPASYVHDRPFLAFRASLRRSTSSREGSASRPFPCHRRNRPRSPAQSADSRKE